MQRTGNPPPFSLPRVPRQFSTEMQSDSRMTSYIPGGICEGKWTIYLGR